MSSQEKIRTAEILLQRWNDIIGTPNTGGSPSAPLCRGRAGAPCHTPPGGGACDRCGYPVAYAHPSSLLEAFRVEALWIGGTAILVNSNHFVRPGIVLIVQTDGSSSDHPIPGDPEGIGGDDLSPEQISRISRRMEAAAQHPSVEDLGSVVADNRPNLDVAWTTIGPFSAPLSRLRIALFPGEADHVELYDIRVGEERNRPLGTSVISKLPGYSPEAVREIQNRVDIQGTPVHKYLPGTALAGQLRDGAAFADPTALSPKDLLGGVEINLGQTLPPRSCVYLFYRIMPGHVFYAVVEPLVPAPSQEPVALSSASQQSLRMYYQGAE